MIGWSVLLLLLLPATVGAQELPLRVQGPDAGVDAAAAYHHGYPAYPAATLRALGARVDRHPWGVAVLLFGDTIRFEALSPFFRIRGRAVQLATAPYAEAGVVYLPHQLFVEWLPAHYSDRLRYREGRLEWAPRVARDDPRPQRGLARGRSSEPLPPLTEPATLDQPRTRADGDGGTRVVVIDAGHGGRDPGTTGPNGVREKDVVLAVAKRLAALLRERDGYEVHLTRTRDTLIALDDRAPMANDWKAGRPSALFLSLHANSFSPRARGFETYFLSEARTDDERRVAEMENAAVQYEENGAAGATGGLDYILNNLRNDFYLRASNDLAEVIQNGLAGFHPGPDRGVKQAPFRVLVGAFMPAVLVEMAFLSNPEEARLLATSAFQQKLAWALAAAVDRYFATHEYLWAAGEPR